jgi:hypothetical protein
MKTKTMTVASLIALSVSAPAFAAEGISSTESKSLLQQFKDSPFSLSTELENYSNLELNEFKGSRLDTSLIYKLSDKNVLKSGVRLLVNQSGDDFETTFSKAYVGYQRKGLLSNDKHGLDLGAQTRLYKYGESSKSEGALQLRLDFGKKFSDKVTSGGVALYEEYLKVQDGETRRMAYFEGGPTLKVNKNLDLSSTLILHREYKNDSHSSYASLSVTPDYKVTEKVNFSYEVGVDRDFSEDLTTYGVNVNPAVSYSMNDQLSASLDYSTQVFSVSEGQTYGRQWLQNGKVTLNMAYSL